MTESPEDPPAANELEPPPVPDPPDPPRTGPAYEPLELEKLTESEHGESS
jgi:hypothetical protein